MISVLDQFDYRGKKQNFKRDAFDTIADMVAFSENYLPPVFETYCYEDGNKYRYRETNDVDPVLGKWRVVTEGGMSELPTASATVKGGVKIGEGLTMEGETLKADVQSDENFTTELKEKLESIDMSTKVDTEEGKGLSTNDLTDELKAQYDKAEENVQSDWDETDETVDSFIKGKPTKLSDFDNDKEFITKAVDNLENYYKSSETYTQSEVNALVNAINSFELKKVDVLPVEDINPHCIYFVPHGDTEGNIFNEFIYIDNKWENLGPAVLPTSGKAEEVTYENLKHLELDNVQKALDAVIERAESVPKPTAADRVLLSAIEDEKPVWTEVDKDEVGGTTQFIGTQEEWNNLTIEEKARYDGKEVIFTDGETQLDSDKRIVICIGDSYNMNTDMWTGWGECLKTVNPNLEVYSYEASGGGFVANTYQYDFLGALQNHSQDEEVSENKKKLVSDIVVLGGYNDCSVNATQVQITDKVKEFVDYCKKNYPNAKITIGSISFDYNSAETQGKLATYQVYYKKAANLCGVKFYNNFTYILRNTSKIYFSDSNPNSGFHPNTTGNISVADYLNEYLYNGVFDVKDGCIQCGAFVYSLNGNICISPTPPQGSNTEQGFMEPMLEGKTIPFNTWTDIGLTINENGQNLLWGAIPSVTAYWSVNVCKQVNNTEVGFVTNLICKLENKHIYVKNVANVNSITFDGSLFLDSSSKNFYFDSQLIY